jgi:hypothetical protein
MILPSAERAIIDIAKLRDYCLSEDHPRGRHKVRVFASVLGFTSAEAEILRIALLQAVTTHQATPTVQDAYGQRYVVDVEIETAVARATVRSAWIIRVGETFPRLTSCYVL